MILGIDASNIRAGGGLTHLNSILNSANKNNTNFTKIIVWASKSTLSNLQENSIIEKRTHKLINKSSIHTLVWQIFIFSKLAKSANCDLVFAPGSTFLSSFRPFVTMSQNMLPFEFQEAFRFKSFLTRLRFIVLYLVQSYSFKKANGLIFLTDYARSLITKKINISSEEGIIIPHGINTSFMNKPRLQHDINQYNEASPFKILYVSIVTAYKHQWNVAKAIVLLRKAGLPVVLEIVGPKVKDGFDKLQEVINNNDPNGEFINYRGAVDHEILKDYYLDADAFVFASSCENMPIILIEAMSAGLPIACSNRGPMPEVLKDAGFYFDPENVASIKNALNELMINSTSREDKVNKSYSYVSNYTWQNCADRTFEYLLKVANNNKQSNKV